MKSSPRPDVPLHTRAAALAGMAAAVSVAPAALRAADLTTIRIGAQVTDATAEHLYAQELGLYAPAGLSAEISPLRNSGELVAAVAGGSLDVMAATVVSVAVAHSKGIDLLTIAPEGMYDGHSTQAAIVVAADSPIRSGADLNGKTVSVNGLGDATQMMMDAWIDATGGNYKSVKVVEIPFPTIPTALSQGRIDAALLVEPFITAAGKTIKVIGDPQATLGKDYMVTGWFAMRDWLNANRDVAQRFVNVMLQTAKWANGHQDQSAAILAKALHISPANIVSAPRAVYGETPVTPAMIQPVLDYSTKYIGLAKTSAASLIWHA